MASGQETARPGLSSKAEKEADLVMGTNNSSIVSKRSVEMLYYPKPHFFRSFVKKPQRRAPLINREYWLRMHAIGETVRQFMRESSDRPKFVLNLGCGFDPLPYMLLSGESSLCRNTTFVDIDYEKLMVNKKTAIRRSDDIIRHLEDVEFFPDANPIQVRSKRYLAVGCDLKNLEKLDNVLKTDVLPETFSVLFLAEVSLTYMDIESASAVVNWASKLSDDAHFCMLEQFLPDGPDHPFASTMTRHYKKLGAPLYSIHKYPSLKEQEHRFTSAGWAQANARSLWDLWSDDTFVPSSLRRSLDSIEPFDEWEEFALFTSHYFLLRASTQRDSSPNTFIPSLREALPDLSHHFHLRHKQARGGQRRFGAIIPDGENSIGHHSGLNRQSRVASTDLYSKSDRINNSRHPFPREVSARMCHTITELTENRCLLVGGRASPASGFQDCWLREKDEWRVVRSLPAPRFRHSAVKVTLESECVLVYGGKTSGGDPLDSWLLWDSNNREWQQVETGEAHVTARSGACLAAINDASGVVFGGIGRDGTIFGDFWTWRLHRRNDGSYYMELENQTERLQSSPMFRYLNRFGATVNPSSQGLFIIGGIIPRQTVPIQYEMMLLDTTTLMNKTLTTSGRHIISAIGLGADFEGPRPLLVGHVSRAISPDQILILGGGAVCFPFGTAWTEGTWLLQKATAKAENTWAFISDSTQMGNQAKRQISLEVSGDRPTNKGSGSEITSVPRIRVETASQFQDILTEGKPVIITESDIGPCTELWTKEYLANAVGCDRKVVVHDAHTENMSFQSKNFSYVTKPFGTFLNEIHAGGRQYLRSISAEEPSKLPASLAMDFPGLKNDFRLPEPFSIVAEKAHSSPLRISGPVTLWLHYDVSWAVGNNRTGSTSNRLQVMANVLCQIRGEKRLILFPPRDVQHLQVPPGASSSTLDIFQDNQDGSIVSIPHTSPHEAILKPGDILFLPPLWLHTAAPTEQVSVAVNVFFRNLDKGYATGRDVYGNRDLHAYEKARNDLQKITNSFDGLPQDMIQFYLLRLAQELKEKTLV
ncbi:hypothetical protein BDV59DRAFT_97903 [Aspergillus ambiguus]|uniref:tRNA methyltransferase PPM2 n=1 Tax=Aspergillus ambiguus TaxID=176160 RepID=UPI003CCDF706